jgi:hypothetical protein
MRRHTQNGYISPQLRPFLHARLHNCAVSPPLSFYKLIGHKKYPKNANNASLSVNGDWPSANAECPYMKAVPSYIVAVRCNDITGPGGLS